MEEGIRFRKTHISKMLEANISGLLALALLSGMPYNWC